MKGDVLNQYGSTSVLKNVETQKPAYRAEQLLVNIKALGLNLVDAKVRAGLIERCMALSFPLTLGGEASGVAETNGSAVKNYRVGDQVRVKTSMVLTGTYVQFTAVNKSEAASKPRTLLHIQAAAVPMGGDTVYTGLVKTALSQKAGAC